MRAAREARIAAWEASQRDNGTTDTEPRDVGEILIDAAHQADRIARALRGQLDERGVVVGPTLEALADWLDRASRVAKTVVDAKVDVRRVELEAAKQRVVVSQANEVEVVLRIALAELGHLWDHPATLAALEVALERAEAGLSLPEARTWPVRQERPALPAAAADDGDVVEAVTVDEREVDTWPTTT